MATNNESKLTISQLELQVNATPSNSVNQKENIATVAHLNLKK